MRSQGARVREGLGRARTRRRCSGEQILSSSSIKQPRASSEPEQRAREVEDGQGKQGRTDSERSALAINEPAGRGRPSGHRESRGSVESNEHCVQIVSGPVPLKHRELFGAKQGIGPKGPPREAGPLEVNLRRSPKDGVGTPPPTWRKTEGLTNRFKLDLFRGPEVGKLPRFRQLDDPKVASRLFTRLSDKAERIRIATAWGAPDSPVVPSLSKAQEEGRLKLVVGWDFDGTHPTFLRRFRQSLRVKRRAAGATFHPKAYLFVKGGRFDAIVGSSNLTRGGFDRNVELNLHVSGFTREPFFKDLDDYVQRQWDGSREISHSEIDEYQKRWRKAKRLRPPKEPEISSTAARTTPQIIVDPRLDVNWTEFYRLLHRVDGAKHNVFPKANEESYLGVIAYVQERFARNRSLARMSREERSNVAGTNTHSAFGYFGTTHSVGSFTHAVLDFPALIDRALDQIPFGGRTRVTKAQFDRFFDSFRRFARSLGRPRPALGCATRLLAMKRPDTFLCVNGENRARLSKAFGFADAELRTASGYWKLCEHIWSLPWHRSPLPRGNEQRLAWRARVALVDAFYSED
jgi:HKD family nuclease